MLDALVTSRRIASQHYGLLSPMLMSPPGDVFRPHTADTGSGVIPLDDLLLVLSPPGDVFRSNTAVTKVEGWGVNPP